MTLLRARHWDQLTLVDVALDHDTHDALLAVGDLLGQAGGNLGLVLVVLERVAVAAVDHQALLKPSLSESGLGLGDALSIVVGATRATTQDDEAVLVANGAHDGHHTGLGHRQEVMGVFDGANGINGHSESAVGSVLEANGEAETASQLAVELTLRCPGADSANAEQVGQELGADGVQHLAGNGHALGGKVDEQLPADAQTLVDIEAVVDIRVVDQTLPADRGARLLEVGAHHDQQLVLVLFLLLQQQIAVFEGGLGIVDRTRADDDQQPLLLIGAMDDGDGLITALEHGLFGLGGLRNLVLEKVGRRKGIVTANCGSLVLVAAPCDCVRTSIKGAHTPPVFTLGLVSDVLVLNVESLVAMVSSRCSWISRRAQSRRVGSNIQT